MHTDAIDFPETGLLPALVADYLRDEPALRPFYDDRPDPAGAAAAMARRQGFPVDRERLADTLDAQYRRLAPGDGDADTAVRQAIASLRRDNTFTVTTGHQLNLCAGPLYFLYKIFSTIRLARRLAASHPGSAFVPVYWMASEDHDVAEIDHLHLFGKRVAWENPGTGAAGRLATATLAPVLDALKAILGDSPHARRLDALFRAAYLGNENLADATRHLVHALAGRYGLVVLDADDAALKRAFAPVMRDDLLNRTARRLVAGSVEALGDRYKEQVHPRDINLFLLSPGQRDRIVARGDGFETAGAGKTFGRDELLALLESNPERFSPNVVLRPLYQETVLPNVAYVGGPAEISYWLEYKRVFDHYRVCYPQLLLRRMVLWIDAASAGRMESLGFGAADLFRPADELVAAYVSAHAENPVDLSAETKDLEALFDRIRAKAVGADEPMLRSIDGERTKAVNQVKVLEGKLLRAEKRRHETAVSQIGGLKDKFFPGGAFQERHDNFSAWYLRHGDPYLDFLQEHLDPFDARLLVVTETAGQ